jgi:hypothetical protein
MNERDILKWAAGGRKSLPDFDGVCEPRLLSLLGINESHLYELLIRHRLPQRFLMRYASEHSQWCGVDFLESLARFQQSAMAKLQRQLAVLEEIEAALPKREKPLILLKGISTVASLQSRRLLRASSDLDICYDDLDMLWDTLINLGFQGKRHFTYEFGKFKRQDITIDVHEYYPILSYPEYLEAVDIVGGDKLDFSKTSTILNGPMHPTVHALRYQDMCERITKIDLLGTKQIRILDLHALALLLCAHSFKNHVIAFHHLSEDRISRLGELADIAELSLDQRFDSIKFLEIVKQYQAGDAISFTANLLDKFDIEHALPNPAPRDTYPENFFWGGWAHLDSEEEFLVKRSTTKTVSLLNPPLVPVTDNSARSSFNHTYLFNPLVVRDEKDTVGPSDDFSTQFRFTQENRDLKLQIRLSDPKELQLIAVHFGDDWMIKVAVKDKKPSVVERKKQFSLESQCQPTMVYEEQVCWMQLNFDLDALPMPYKRKQWPVIIARSKDITSHSNQINSAEVQYFPLTLCIK